MSDSVLEIKGLRKRFGSRHALDGLDLSVPRGSVFGLVGSNGAGKTTTMSIVAGMVRPSGGSVDLLRDGPFNPERHAGRVTLLPQNSELPRYARVRDLLAFYAELQGIPQKECRAAAHRILEAVHLADRADSAVRTLSHGMQKRVMIAQAFLGTPELILLDEPLSGLDPKEVVNIRSMLRKLCGAHTIVISSHNLHEIEILCDHVAFIEQGRLVQQAPMSAVVGHLRVVRYYLDVESLPLELLEGLLPGVAFDMSSPEGSAHPDKRGVPCLVCEVLDQDLTVAQVNAIVLKHLVESGVGVLEVRRGADLERVYMAGAGSSAS